MVLKLLLYIKIRSNFVFGLGYSFFKGLLAQAIVITSMHIAHLNHTDRIMVLGYIESITGTTVLQLIKGVVYLCPYLKYFSQLVASNIFSFTIYCLNTMSFKRHLVRCIL